MPELRIWLEGMQHPFVLRFNSVERASDCRAALDQCASEKLPAGYVRDDTGYEVGFRIKLLVAVELVPDVA